MKTRPDVYYCAQYGDRIVKSTFRSVRFGRCCGCLLQSNFTIRADALYQIILLARNQFCASFCPSLYCTSCALSLADHSGGVFLLYAQYKFFRCRCGLRLVSTQYKLILPILCLGFNCSQPHSHPHQFFFMQLHF